MSSDLTKLCHQDEPNPAPEWLSTKAWQEILAMRVLPNFVPFIDTFDHYKHHYREIFESQDPHRFNSDSVTFECDFSVV